MATTQFEVYVFDDGRWTLHARYSADERNEAVRDAGVTGSSLRLRTKVVRETYFPERNATECITIYTSPKSKPADQLAALPRQIRHAPSKPVRGAVSRLPRIAMQEAPRILLTASVSLFLAAVITLLIGRTLQRFSVIDVALSARTSSSVLPYFYIGAFFLIFLPLLRSRMLLQRLLSDLWAHTPSMRSGGAGVPRRPHGAGPKQSRAHSPRTSLGEGDRQHGDLDFSIPAPNHSPRETAPVSPPPLQEAESLTVESAPSVEGQSAAEPAMPQPTLEPAPHTASAEEADVLAEGCAVLRRFVHVQLKPAALVMANGPVTQRGISLVLAGAVDALVSSAPYTAIDSGALLAYALECAGLTPNTVASFLTERDSQKAADADAALVSAGAASMEAYRMASVPDPFTLAKALLEWRSRCDNLVASARETLHSIDTNVPTPIEVFLLMELRPRFDQEQASEVEQAHHAAIVRAALELNNGNEVKRADDGILARFSRADAAINAAFEIQGVIGRPVAIALIGNSDISEDSAFLPKLIQRAEAALQSTADNTLTAELTVHAAASLPHVRGDLLTEHQYKYGELLRLTHVAQPEIPAATEAHLGFGGFAREAAGVIALDQLNPYARFCFNLYLAGAASFVGQVKCMPREDQLAMLRDALHVAGNSAERTETFCVDLPSHGKNPKYADMIQSGAQAMSQRVSGENNAVDGLAALLSKWSLPERRQSAPSLITFLFTDMVDSMEMTQDIGNIAAQRALRAHNAAVRAAIENSQGREVKHLGDGIMAVFPDPPSAVAAAIQTQRYIAQHNAESPSLHISVRIGINLGEAVEEENDFFGVAVQMTARICDAATRDNIWVSQGVVDACEGQQIVFIRRGRFEMKGVRDAKVLYEVGWTGAHKNEIRDL